MDGGNIRFGQLTVFAWGLHFAMAVAQPASTVPVSARYPDVAKCFFVCAALNESARRHAKPELESYAVQRLMWVRGFMNARSDDPAWKSQFESGLKANKSFAVSIEAKLSAAAASNSTDQYNAAIAEGEICDRRLGLVHQSK